MHPVNPLFTGALFKDGMKQEMAEGQKNYNPEYSRLLELLHGSYLRKGVRTSLASKLEQVRSLDLSVNVSSVASDVMFCRQRLSCK